MPISVEYCFLFAVYKSLSAPLAAARADLMELLSNVLFGDRLAAEYLLLYLLSDV